MPAAARAAACTLRREGDALRASRRTGRAELLAAAVISERHSETGTKRSLWQRFAGVEKNGPVLLIGEHVSKLAAKIVHQRGAAIEEHSALASRGPEPAQPNGASAAGRLASGMPARPISAFPSADPRLQWLLRFQRSDLGPREAALERARGRRRTLAPHRPASGAVVCPLRRLQRQMDVGQEVGRPHKLWIVEIGLEYWSVVWLVA